MTAGTNLLDRDADEVMWKIAAMGVVTVDADHLVLKDWMS